MNKVFHIAAREYVETAKTKVFLFSVFLTPLVMGGIIFVIGRVNASVMKGERPAMHIVVVDQTNVLQADLEQAFNQHNAAKPKRVIQPAFQPVEEGDVQVERLKAEVREGELDGCLVIPDDALEKGTSSRYYMKTVKIAGMEAFGTAQRLLYDAAIAWRVRQRNIPSEVLADIRRDLPVIQVDVSAETEQEGPQMLRLMTPFFFLFLMFMGVFGTSQGMLTSVIEEKNSRVIEVLLSAVSPFQLMMGKIAGLGAIGLSVVAVWGTVAYAAAVSQGLGDLIVLANLGYFLIYFLLGFVLLSSVYAAIGAACNTLKEAQALMMPVMMIVIIPMIAWFYIVQNPDGLAAVLLSFFPFTTSTVMILRLAAWPEMPLIQIVGSIGVLAVSVPVVLWAAGKIFRTGILMYGKPPTPRELLRWVRYS